MDPRHGSFPTEGGTFDLHPHPPTEDSATVRAVKDIAFGSVGLFEIQKHCLTDGRTKKDRRNGR